MAAMMKKMAGMGMRDRMKAMQELQQGGLLESRRADGQGQGRHRQTADAPTNGPSCANSARRKLRKMQTRRQKRDKSAARR